ncbi:helix-turn-helix domain-containing protein [Chitinophaga sp. SYP-B3965]|uniref:AraC family transcriptional regulator n=1 Tax=Chitinophaga sp. SYP-B3965 TaxID=2663120 RepID=UPI001299C697|nr:AraC family transcriptional regulator [Chitinophaga sp. SYP-B3965]MRG45162.1 helix-turn-helix domain-containing protein [Chitinophaga sp. SYP-B3965]
MKGISLGEMHSFSIRQDVIPYYYTQFHAHAEVEIIHIEEGKGLQFIGKHVAGFQPGDVVMIGANVPHYWKRSEEEVTMATLLHFREDFWGETFLRLGENTHIRSLLNKAKQGILIKGETGRQAADMLSRMLGAGATEKLILLLNLLHVISRSPDLQFLSVSIIPPDKDEMDRINNVYKYSQLHFTRKIDLEEIAAVACISPNSFCRFFKSKTKKTFSRFLMELRVGHACKLLMESRLNNKRICYESGFNNFSNFHKCFKQVTGKSPLEYQKSFQLD